MIQSAGFILFREDENKKILFLLLCSRTGIWGFPKGCLKKNENKIEAAVRELFEETGINHFYVVAGFSHSVSYHLPSGNLKNVFLQTAKTNNKKVILSREHTDYAWLNYSDAINLLVFNNSKRTLQSCYDYIRNNRSLIMIQEKTYSIVEKIPKGKTKTYKSISDSFSGKVHPRTVGSFLNKNYNPNIPCHRVVYSNGCIGGYNKGVVEKIKKLKQEKVLIKRNRDVLRIDLK